MTEQGQRAGHSRKESARQETISWATLRDVVYRNV